ncbi:uncharacterized protein LOC141530765 [Cotesia typhae]|uniref:uncharacterized protein LOC141530765 n=1 Tax=Cotesia typhae TaxID=2053667 RepID=UPI003D68FDEC
MYLHLLGNIIIMSEKLTHKGRFIKKKVLEKRQKSLAAMAKAKKKRNSPQQIGTRIVDVDELMDNLICCLCEKDLLLKNIVKETKFGLSSVFSIKCENCSTLTNVKTSKKHITKDNTKHSDINTKIVLGAVHAGVEYTCLRKILACADVPMISQALYKRYEREVGPVIEEVAKESCKQAAEEERSLVVKNIEKLCEELPEEISQEIYKEYFFLKAAITADVSSTSSHSDSETLD